MRIIRSSEYSKWLPRLDRGDQERDRLAGAGLGGTEDIAAGHQRGYRTGLNLGHLGESHVLNGVLGSLGDIEGLEVEVNILD
ncbi:hypothetical protein BC938DRAFT_475896 [Jimgerdemannia flammicorona]|uniref:Uncharacterized protein n=1 Tax=Jimgerdemannia flammicorona TaxID=994334 RepID=A0A433PMI2_9FUNG|nr:hypothetical protein BC938DRAFT_475896 [Jimgerdemannia flammicorona]